MSKLVCYMGEEANKNRTDVLICSTFYSLAKAEGKLSSSLLLSAFIP